MSRCTKKVALASATLLAVLTPALPGTAQEAEKPRPKVEVVFCLDTTGSMGGLINAAKQKIWSISNQIAAGQPTPDLRVGLVAYRDRGDKFVTQVFDLTDDLDAVYANLMKFDADGGGDFPESVNQALHESVTKIGWSAGKGTLKIIFLVGDAPPKTDYPDDVDYTQTCQTAAKQGIIINTVQCGGHKQTQEFWQKIARLAEGSYVQIAADGGPVVVVKTPFDKELVEINAELAKSTIVYGDERARRAGEMKKADAAGLDAPAAASRAAFAGKLGRVATYDLLDGIKAGKVKLAELKDEELPAELRELSPDEREAFLEKVARRRDELTQRALELDRQRSGYIRDKLAEQTRNSPARDGFDEQVLRVLQSQARRVNLEYPVEPAPAEPKKE